MIRTVTQEGDTSRPTITVEFDEKQIQARELLEPLPASEGAEPGPAKLVVHLAHGSYAVTEPDAIAKLWKAGKKPGKR